MQISLNKKEKQHIYNAVKHIDYDGMGGTNYLTQLRKLGYQIIPERILNLLEEQKSGLNIKPYFIIDNLPVDEIITGSPKFHETGAGFKSGSISENIICMFGAILGEPYSVFFEGQELVNNLTPHPTSNLDYTGLGSEVELDLHIENSALRFLDDFDRSPGGILLFGVREQKNSKHIPFTNVVDAVEALKFLTKEDIEILESDSYLIKFPFRWRQVFSDTENYTRPCPMISGKGEQLKINAVFYSDMVTPLNERAETALKNFYLMLKNTVVKINITPGKMVYIDNSIALHSRDKFIATYDELGCAYRWVQRLFIMPNLFSLKNFNKIGPRVFNPLNPQHRQG